MSKKNFAKKTAQNHNHCQLCDESTRQVLEHEPTNKQEERDFLLAKLISDRENVLWRLTDKIKSAEFSLEKSDLDREIHQMLLKGLSKEKQADWQYNFSEDYYQTILNRLNQLQTELTYEKKWLETAKKFIKTKKYLNLPSLFFQSYHFDYENEFFWDDGCENHQNYEPEEIPF